MAEHTSHRASRSLRKDRLPRRWAVLVPVIAALAGLLFTTTARTAAGTTLRDDRRPELTRVIGERKTEVADENALVAALQSKIDATTAAEAGSDGRIAEQQQRADAVRAAAGLVAVHGPGLRVILNDAPVMFNAEVVLFSVMPVTFEPMIALIRVAPEPVPDPMMWSCISRMCSRWSMRCGPAERRRW